MFLRCLSHNDPHIPEILDVYVTLRQGASLCGIWSIKNMYKNDRFERSTHVYYVWRVGHDSVNAASATSS